ncbi:MAG: serine/threonine-protein kinase [Myxococcota bacterium]
MAGEPRQFGSYRLLRRLGVGGMAETFEAVRIGTGGFEQRVCLKRVLPAYGDDPEFTARFRREAQLAAGLRHSNIVGVTDFGEVGRVSYLALELVDGVDLRSLLKSVPEHRLDPDMVAWIGLDLAYALEHAHGSVIHRDVSPSNVLISRTGEVKLADFGIAKAIEGAAVTDSRSVQGKVPYMSPEQIRGRPLDARSDLFSLGVVLFEAAAGVRPFQGAHDVVTMQQVVDNRRADLAEVAPELPDALRRCIEGLLETDPAERTQTAAAVVEALSVLEPQSNARRRLAAMVEAQRGGPETRMHVRARRDERDTEMSPADALPMGAVGASAEQVRQASLVGRRRRTTSRWLLGALFLLAIAVGAAWLRAPSGRVDKTSIEASTTAREPSDGSRVPVPKAPTAPPRTLDAASASGEAKKEAPSLKVDAEPSGRGAEKEARAKRRRPAAPAARSGPGWVQVVVQPWGNVWIDGVWMGRAPVTAKVAEGRHVIEVGRERPSKKRVVRVEAGDRKKLELELGDLLGD